MALRYSTDKYLPADAQLNSLLKKVGWLEENWAAIRGHADCEIVTAWSGEKCVGMGTLLAQWPMANLGTVCVDPDYEGRGAGSEISVRLIALAREKECLEVTSDTSEKRMRRILEKLGFEASGAESGKTFFRLKLSSI